MTMINLCPHSIVLNDGRTVEPSGIVARVSSSYTEFDSNLVAEVKFGDIQNLPDPVPGTLYVVSGLVLAAAKDAGRYDCVAPATGHVDCVRDEKGQIVSVPGFVR